MEYLIRVVVWLMTVPGILLAGFGTKETSRMVRHMKNTFGKKIILYYIGFALFQIHVSYMPTLLYTVFFGICIIYHWKFMNEVHIRCWIKGFAVLFIYIVCNLFLQKIYFSYVASDVWNEVILVFVPFELLSILLIITLCANKRHKKINIVLFSVAIMNILDFICLHFAIITGELYDWKYLLLVGITLRAFLTYMLLVITSLENLSNLIPTEKKISDEEVYEYYLHLEKEQMEVRKMYHDMKNHLMVLEAKESAEVRDYVQQLKETLKKEEDFLSTGKKELDIFLYKFREQARKKEVELEITFEKDCLNFISNKDLMIIFSNALDNAMEACVKLKREKRKIEVKAMHQYNNVILLIKNPISSQMENILETMKRNKERHGFGIINMRDAIEKNGGILSIQSENGFFQVSVLFVTKEQ